MRIFSTAALLAIASFAAGVSGVCGCDRKSDASTDAVHVPPPAPGEVRVTASEHGFAPGEVAIPKGQPGSLAKVTFVRTTDQTCATEVVFPDLDIKKPLPLGQVVAVDIPSDTAKTLTFQCGMGMYKGALLVK
jgi:plastocyanin domain-containing protein